MKKNTLLLAAIILALARSGQAQTPVQGTSLTIQGYTDGSSVYNEPIISLEKDNTSGAPYVSLSYVETGGVGNFLQFLGKTGAQWQWQTLGSSAPRLQMQLDANNILTLLDPNSANTIVLHPGTDANSGIYWNGNRLATVSEMVPLVNNGLTVGSNGKVGIGTSNPGQQLTITGNFEIPTTTATAGAIYQNGAPLIHTYGDHNEFFGDGAGNFSMTGGANVGIGNSALHANTTGNLNVALGYFALASNVDGYSSVAIGPWALTRDLHGWGNIAVGQSALENNQGNPATNTGLRNIAVGGGALQSNTSGSFNSAIGFQALVSNTTGNSNMAMGDWALSANTTGEANTAVGIDSLWNNVTGGQNSALGFYSLVSNKWGVNNTAVGAQSLTNNIGIEGDAYAGGSNTAVGAYSVVLNTIGQANVGIGFFALYDNTTGNSNTGVGAGAGISFTTGSNNTAIGNNSGVNATTGNNNVFIGMFSGLVDPVDGNTPTVQRSNAIAIGYNARVDADHAMVLGGTGGDALNVGINTTKPQEKLDVNGNAVVRGVLHVAPGGDIDMGAFTAGTNPTLPPP